MVARLGFRIQICPFTQDRTLGSYSQPSQIDWPFSTTNCIADPCMHDTTLNSHPIVAKNTSHQTTRGNTEIIGRLQDANLDNVC
jgi:hypothetical protein